MAVQHKDNYVAIEDWKNPCCFSLLNFVDVMVSSHPNSFCLDTRNSPRSFFFFLVGEHHGMPSAKETLLKKKKEEMARIRGSATSVDDDQAMDTSESGTSGDSSTLARSILMSQHGLTTVPSPVRGITASTAASVAGAVYGATGRLLQAGGRQQHGQPVALSGGIREKTKTTAQRKREMYVRMFETMNIGDHTVVINSLVNKVTNNLTYWADDHEIISDTLTVFYWLSNGYGSGQFMLSLDSVSF